MNVEIGVLHIIHVAIAIHVLAVEIRHDGEDRRQLEERSVAFVSLGNKVLRGAELCVRTQRVNTAADNDCRIQSSSRKSPKQPLTSLWSCRAYRQ